MPHGYCFFHTSHSSLLYLHDPSCKRVPRVLFIKAISPKICVKDPDHGSLLLLTLGLISEIYPLPFRFKLLSSSSLLSAVSVQTWKDFQRALTKTARWSHDNKMWWRNAWFYFHWNSKQTWNVKLLNHFY